MHFGLSQEQLLLQETVRGFAAAECPPTKLREIFDSGRGHDDAIWQGLAEMGLTGLLVPEDHGGAGLGILELALVCEIAGAAALPGALLEHSLACLAVSLAGSDDQQSHWLPRLASGDVIGTLALAEGVDRWRPGRWQTSLSAGALNGRKDYVPHLAHAGLVVVGAETGELALLDWQGDATAGVQRKPQEGIDRTRPIEQLILEGASAELLSGGGRAKTPSGNAAMRVIDAGLAALAADSFGAATQLIQLSVAYAKERKQFGFPIAQFQAVKHQLARMGTQIEPTRALFWYAAHALDQNMPDAERHAAMAKAHITDCAMDVARDAVELHGGLGFTWECDVQAWFKRAMFNRSFLGTPQTHREHMASLSAW